jgi:hypothetical protein
MYNKRLKNKECIKEHGKCKQKSSIKRNIKNRARISSLLGLPMQAANNVSSAFRAGGPTTQPVALNTTVKVLFPNEQFDLAGEYNPATSTFVPLRNGLYAIMATIVFEPTNRNINYDTRVDIRVNGFVQAVDQEFRSGRPNIVSVSTILRLRAGDRVEIFASSSIAGDITEQINVEDITATHFEAARFPD